MKEKRPNKNVESVLLRAMIKDLPKVNDIEISVDYLGIGKLATAE